MRLVHPHSGRHRHEWVDLIDLEELCRALFQNSGSEWTKRFAVLHPGVDVVLHRYVAGVRQNGSIAEGTGTDLEPTLKPADNLACGQITSNRGQQLLLAHAPVSQSSVLQRADDFGVAIFLTEKRMCQLEAATMSQRLMIVPKRAAEGSARVRTRKVAPTLTGSRFRAGCGR